MLWPDSQPLSLSYRQAEHKRRRRLDRTTEALACRSSSTHDAEDHEIHTAVPDLAMGCSTGSETR